MSNSNNNETFDKQFKKYLRWFIGAIILIFVIFFTLLNVCNGWILNFTWTGPIGDTLGGIMGPFVGILGAGLSFLAFWVQYKANEEQKQSIAEQKKALEKQEEQIEKQTRDLKVERFESKFYEMLRLHRANVEEMNVGDTVLGRKVFVRMFYELELIYKIYDASTNDNIIKNEASAQGYDYSKVNKTSVAYHIFFYGMGENSEKQFRNSLTKTELYFFDKTRKKLEQIQKLYEERKNKRGYYSITIPPNSLGHPIFPKLEIDLFYYPFDGHVNKLAHYYRHLYHTVKYVTQQDYLSQTEKEFYIRTFRAQLSNFEQLLLYYNGIAFFEDHWEDLFTKYRLVKNLPLSLATLGENPEDKYITQVREQAELNKKVFELQKTQTKWERDNPQPN